MQTLTDVSCPDMTVTYSGWVEAKSDSHDWVFMKTTAWGDCLFMEGELQSCERDEHIYHETLVHPLFLGLTPKRVLILGGGEGCTAREVLRWPSVEAVTQLDWDAELCSFFRKKTSWNQGAFEDPRLTLVHEDVTTWLPACQETFDAILVDLCDPSESTLPWFLGVLDSALAHLAPTGGLVVNAGETRIGQRTVACTIAEWLAERYPQKTRLALKQFVPSFLGEWCFLGIAPRTWSHQKEQTQIPEGVKHLTRTELIHSLTWKSAYPEPLRTFWSAPISPDAQTTQQDRKLEVGFKPEIVIDWETHYGC